ncbi:glycosyltransferase [bacterium]|nr:glycosyltransferase [bacterium]MBU1614878.1 glycosyltransferase [bacterium]
MNKVTVIIPTYNRASFLASTVESVLSQDYPDFEVLVIDDGSTDRTREAIKPYLSKINYLCQEHKGVSAARNHGIKLAEGEYIAFLDSDDLWKKEKLSIQVRFMEERGIKVSQTEEIWIRNGRRVNPGERHKKYSGWIFDKVLSLCLISPSSMMVKREVFSEKGLFDENLPACEDYDLGLRLAKDYEIGLISKPLIIKQGGHPDQLSKKYWGMDRFRVRALEKVLGDNPTSDQRRLVLRVLEEKCKILSQGALKRGRMEEAKEWEHRFFVTIYPTEVQQRKKENEEKQRRR